jgi:hypothetical protein
MTSPFAAIDAIFNRPRDAAAVLFLIEDSTYMASLWSHLRASYLPPLLSAIKASNLSVAVSLSAPVLPFSPIATLQAKALWMTASDHVPFEPSFDPSAHRKPRWDDIPAIEFSSHGGNTISPINVTRAIEVRDLVLVASPLTRNWTLGIVSNFWPRTRRSPPYHRRSSESLRNSCVVRYRRAAAPST